MGVNGKFIRASVVYRWRLFFLRLHGRVKVAVSQFFPLEMVAMQYFWVNFATDKLDTATSMRPWRDTLRPTATLRRLENDL